MKQDLSDEVRLKYAAVAESTLSTDHSGVRAIAEAFGYTPEELSAIPAGANMGLSCGNPTAHASLRPGEVVVDLGCGGGLDVFLAAAKVGGAGRAIGIDMTPAMIDRARKNAQQGVDGKPMGNVEFHLATIDKLPLADGSVDCVISNCVINLAADKPAVFREIFRVLKRGGRLEVSDIALKRSLPNELSASVAAFVGCIAGAISIDEYKRGLAAAGFDHVEVIDTAKDLNAYAKLEKQSGCCSPAMDQPGQASVKFCCAPPGDKEGNDRCDAEPDCPNSGVHAGMADLLKRYDINSYAASVRVYALKMAM